MAASCEVLVYAKRLRGRPRIEWHHNVQYRRFLVIPEQRLMAPLERFVFPDNKRPYFASSIYYLSYAMQVASDLAKQNCDVIHVHNFHQVAALIKRFNPQSKVLLHMHCDWLAELNPDSVRSRLKGLSAVVGCSEFVTKNVMRRFPAVADRCRTIYYGVDVPAFQGGGRIDPSSHARILFVGRVSPEKGIHVLLDAFRLMAARCPTAELHIVGKDSVPSSGMIADLTDDPHTRNLRSIDPHNYRERICATLPGDVRSRVHFRGDVPHSELPDIYRDAAVFAFPSEWHEPFGIPVVEAMASGLPVVGTRSGGIMESIEHGRTGFLVDRGDSRALAEALATLLLSPDLRYAMGQAGLERAASIWGWDRTIEALRGLYDSLANQRESVYQHARLHQSPGQICR
jgi:glycosyltransferase involved in cell wall biosynthesis